MPRPFPFADLNAVEYWQRKLKETGIGKLERQVDTFVELSVTKESPASTELIVTHTICENKNDDFSFKDNTIATVIKTNGVTFEITNTATPDFIKNIIEKFSTNINRNEHNLQKWRFMFNKVFTKRKIRKIMKERK